MTHKLHNQGMPRPLEVSRTPTELVFRVAYAKESDVCCLGIEFARIYVLFHAHAHARALSQADKVSEKYEDTKSKLLSLDLVVHLDPCLKCVAFPYKDLEVCCCAN